MNRSTRSGLAVAGLAALFLIMLAPSTEASSGRLPHCELHTSGPALFAIATDPMTSFQIAQASPSGLASADSLQFGLSVEVARR